MGRVILAPVKPRNQGWKVKLGKRARVGQRDDWICHRCGLPVDQAVKWPHPLSPVADHYPISVCDGGLATMDNLRIAHSLCNGSSGSTPLPDDATQAQREIYQAIWNMRKVNWDKIHRKCRNKQSCAIDHIKKTCDYSVANWLLLKS